MNNDIAAVLKSKRKELNLSVKTVLERLKSFGIEISDKTLYGWESGYRQPDADTFLVLCQLYGIDSISSISGTKNAPSEISEEALSVARDYTQLDDRGKGAVRAILEYEGKAPDQTDPQEPEQSSVIPFPKAKRTNSGITQVKTYYQPSAAGLGNYLDEPPHHIEQYPDGVIPPKTDFGVVITGNSMEPRIHDGGTVFVQAAPRIEPGKIGIFVLNGEAYCKKLVVDHDNDQIHLVSLNPAYEDIIIQRGDELRTLGHVLGQWTRGYPNDDIFGW